VAGRVRRRDKAFECFAIECLSRRRTLLYAPMALPVAIGALVLAQAESLMMYRFIPDERVRSASASCDIHDPFSACSGCAASREAGAVPEHDALAESCSRAAAVKQPEPQPSGNSSGDRVSVWQVQPPGHSSTHARTGCRHAAVPGHGPPSDLFLLPRRGNSTPSSRATVAMTLPVPSIMVRAS
jgi:hypothetical protein